MTRHDNVIAADFGNRAALNARYTIETDILYRDDAVMLTRTTAFCDGEPIIVLHFAGDLATGVVTKL